MGQVLTSSAGQNPARQAAMSQVFQKKTSVYCQSSLWLRYKICCLGFPKHKIKDLKIVIAGGQESMSLAPHAIHLRDGKNWEILNL